MKHSDAKRDSQLSYCKILKTNINVTDMEHTIAYITRNLDALKGDYICVSNVHTTVMAFRDKEYRRIQNSAAMALPDGQPLSIVSRKRGFSEARRVPGPSYPRKRAIGIISMAVRNTHWRNLERFW